MRFRKSIKIMKGVKLNVSKSGISTSIGMRGLNLTLGGKGGTYINYGIPGTGLYDRKKINLSTIAAAGGGLAGLAGAVGLGSMLGGSQASPVPANTPQHTSRRQAAGSLPVPGVPDIAAAPQPDFSRYQFKMTDTGEIQVYDEYGILVSDPALLRKVKKTPEYANAVKSLKSSKVEDVQEANDQFVNIHKLTPALRSEQEWIEDCNNIRTVAYRSAVFDIPQPTIEETAAYLREKAKSEVKSLKFWDKSGKEQEYVDKNLNAYHAASIRTWESKRDKFLAKENERRRKWEEENGGLAQVKTEIENGVLTGNEEYVNAKIEEILSSLELPVEFAVDFDFVPPGLLKVDLDLPEIEDMPDEQANLTGSGKLSVKQKTKAQLLQDYATCVHGLAFFFAGVLFNISPKIKQINIAAYTQRLDPKTGIVKDTYIYSVEFRRNIFSKLNVPALSPIDAFDNFVNTRNMLKTFEMKEIEVR